MSDQTQGGIAWTDETWNPVRGCSRVSKGCEHCYAETVARRFSGPGQPYEGLVRLDAEGRAKAQWNGTVRLVPEHLGDPLRWTRPRKVFVNSMSDLFHEALRFEDIAAIFGVMAASPKHTFQVLTKRPKPHLFADITRFFDEKFAWSVATFGPGDRYLGVLAHIRKELDEIEQEPTSLEEWCDVVLLAMDGAARSAGADGAMFVQVLRRKQATNTMRRWPDWRTLAPDAVSEHLEDGGGA